MVVLDTNVWFAYLSKDDYRHKRAVVLVEALRDDVLVSEYVLLELCTLLAAKKKKDIADRLIDVIEHNDRIQLLPSTPEFFKDVRETFRRMRSTNLSFVDASLLALSRSVPVYTFDRALYILLKKKG